MNAERDRLAAKWFERACDLAPPARRELLAELVREDTELARRVEELLELDGCADLPLDRPAYAGANGLRAPDPESLGRYRILRRLGAGGMGVVYEAEQDHPRRRVALKVLRGGFVDAATLRRFEHEAQVLGWLQHPGIAQVYEAGAALSNGAMQPYIAMELVHGVCLSEFVRERAPGVQELLQLAIALCEAIDHAHQSGVVHRDLKPSNVLVDESGRPRVLDFGIARILRADVEDTAVRTRAGDVLGTPAYMSPEQLEGASENVDARADVYALGVILYELLARRRPHEVDGLGLREVERAVLESDPPLLGTLDRRWRGDLELIVAKALEKDRERRYPSANALAADLKRHLANEPISARKPGFAYRTQRFVRRHRALVVGALGVFLALSAGLAATWRMYLRAEAARADEHVMRTKAEESEAALRETNEYFLSLLEAPNPELGGIDVRMVDVLERAADRIATAFPDRPLQRARLFQSLARTYFGLGEYAQANRYAGEALELWEEHAPSEHETTIDLRQSRAVALAQLGDVAQALEQIDAAVTLLRDEDVPLRRATVHGTRSRVLLALERFEEAEHEARTTAAILDANPSLRASAAAPERLTLVKVLMMRGELDEAEQVCRRSIEAQQADSSDETFELLHTHAALAQVLHRRGRPMEAIPALERALAGFAKLAGPAHPLVATHTGNLAALMLSVGRASDAEPLMREALERARAAVTGPDASVAMKLCTLAQIVRARGDLAQAEQLLREGLAQLEALEQPREVLLANVLLHLGQTLARQGAHEEGASQLQRSLELHERTLGRDRSETAGVAEALAESQRALGNHAEAAELLELAFAARSAVEGANSGAALGAASELAMTWLDLGRIDEALALATECLTSAERDHAANELLLAQVRATSGCCRVRSGDSTAATGVREALAVLEAGLGPEHPLAARVRAHLDRPR